MALASASAFCFAEHPVSDQCIGIPFNADFAPMRDMWEHGGVSQSRIKKFRKTDSHRLWSDRSLPSLPASGR